MSSFTQLIAYGKNCSATGLLEFAPYPVQALHALVGLHPPVKPLPQKRTLICHVSLSRVLANDTPAGTYSPSITFQTPVTDLIISQHLQFDILVAASPPTNPILPLSTQFHKNPTSPHPTMTKSTSISAQNSAFQKRKQRCDQQLKNNKITFAE